MIWTEQRHWSSYWGFFQYEHDVKEMIKLASKHSKRTRAKCISSSPKVAETISYARRFGNAHYRLKARTVAFDREYTNPLNLRHMDGEMGIVAISKELEYVRLSTLFLVGIDVERDCAGP